MSHTRLARGLGAALLAAAAAAQGQTYPGKPIRMVVRDSGARAD